MLPGLFMEGNQTMALKQVEALYGPYAGAIISIEEADADKAISDGWARDPYDPKNAAHIDLSKKAETKDAEKATKDAEEFAAKIRGEATTSSKKSATTTTKAATAGETANYQTRQSRAESSDTKSTKE